MAHVYWRGHRVGRLYRNPAPNNREYALNGDKRFMLPTSEGLSSSACGTISAIEIDESVTIAMVAMLAITFDRAFAELFGLPPGTRVEDG